MKVTKKTHNFDENLLILNNAELEDFDYIFKLKSAQNNTYWSGYKSPPSRNILESWFVEKILKRKAQLGGLFIAYLKTINSGNSIRVGLVNIYSRESNQLACEFGYEVDSRFVGNRIGSRMIPLIIDKAFELGYEDVYCWVREDNIISKKIVLKNNFQQTGILNRKYIENLNKIIHMIEFRLLNR
ncbi:MAG: GNAT family protein [Peptostreptococcales bacterium]